MRNWLVVAAGVLAAVAVGMPSWSAAHDDKPGSAAPGLILLGTQGAPAQGPASARVTLVEFSDYECPFCGRHVRETYPALERDFIRTGKLRYVLRDLPLERIHPRAFRAAEAARCAGEQGKLWEMRARIFADQDGLDDGDLARRAESLGVDGRKFAQCLAAGQEAGAIRRDIAEAVHLGVKGTPTFFLGYARPDGQVRVVKVIEGAQPYPVFKDVIEELLAAPR